MNRTDKLTKYMYFVLTEKKPKTGIWHIRNRGSNAWLGTIQWYPPWRQYIVIFNEKADFNDGCLKDIYDFMQDLRNGNITIA